MKTSGGQPGNKNSTQDKRMITNTLRRALAQSPDKLRAAIEKQLDLAVEGNLQSIQWISDRLEGKPSQTTVLQGDEENPLTVEKIERIIVDSTTRDS